MLQLFPLKTIIPSKNVTAGNNQKIIHTKINVYYIGMNYVEVCLPCLRCSLSTSLCQIQQGHREAHLDHYSKNKLRHLCLGLTLQCKCRKIIEIPWNYQYIKNIGYSTMITKYMFHISLGHHEAYWVHYSKNILQHLCNCLQQICLNIVASFKFFILLNY